MREPPIGGNSDDYPQEKEPGGEPECGDLAGGIEVVTKRHNDFIDGLWRTAFSRI